MQNPSTQIELKPSPKSVLTKTKSDKTEKKPILTGQIHTKKTSPTLVEFQSKNPQMPEWRLQLKNAVHKRFGQNGETATVQAISSEFEMADAAGNAVEPQITDGIRPENTDNKQLANALKRIERSRQKFYIVEPEDVVEVVREIEPPDFAEVKGESKNEKEFPFTIASSNDNPEPASRTETNDSPKEFVEKPTLVPEQKAENIKALYNTSELDPEFPAAKISTSFDQKLDKRETETEKRVVTEKAEQSEQVVEAENTEETFVDEVAPLSLRFNAGLFDVIIGSFSSLILLAPFMLLGGEWFTVTGFFAFVTTAAIVMFIYLTTTIGLFGKTGGMHLFSLEVIDYLSDEYPTFHQAAVSSSIYLFSLFFAGVGFITTFFDEDRRAVHDLVSGTIIVKEL